ncbi:hypothetical protein GYMLUDRAFT_561994 [Collybiopsis luxurians FD-317 M1]|uniref:Uncharacterized protein n=1 Tax=Collybiopsis luxurians FD-317 M1 TaxID=944289 RepID=A0A0D0CHB9_9AGAR|nr:hypothetical protein GYMLUDRAFT_561994 [Collybiopsis luxurians FD-317 M1]
MLYSTFIRGPEYSVILESLRIPPVWVRNNENMAYIGPGCKPIRIKRLAPRNCSGYAEGGFEEKVPQLSPEHHYTNTDNQRCGSLSNSSDRCRHKRDTLIQ